MRSSAAVAILLCTAAVGVAVADPIPPPGAAGKGPSSVGPTADAGGLQATTEKFNAYIAYMNRTLRVIESLDRYKSWVNMKTGPTGRERYIYGLYSVYDVRDERAAAEAALAAEPHLPDLDDAMRAYIAANDRLAPILNKADGYYTREDYKLDHMAEGKAFHTQIVDAGGAFLAARATLETVMTKEKLQLDMIRLATIEKREGRGGHWQVANVMMRAKQALDALQNTRGGDVDMAAFDGAMTDLGTAVRALDDFHADHPSAMSGFTTYPDLLLGELRNVQGRLQRTHGNLRRSAGIDMTLIVSNYNSIVTMSEMPMAVEGK